MSIILDGKKLANKISENIKNEVNKLSIKPKLAVVLVGDNPASQIYVRLKQKKAVELGFDSVDIRYSDNITEEELLKKIQELNNDSSVNAILVQLPLPEHIDKYKIISAISAIKDVDGFNFENVGKLTSRQNPYAIACTARGIVDLLKEYNIEIAGKSVVVVGRSNIVGTPVARLLQNLDATVTVCHSKTKNLSKYTKTADILVSAVGNPKFITKDMVKENSVIVDVGISRVDNKVVGDVDFENVTGKVSYISPVPGGVGPMTIIELMQNTLDLYKLQNQNQ